MKKIYVDYTHAIENKTGKVHGGGNYARTFLLDLKRNRVLDDSSVQVVILWPAKHKEYSSAEKEIVGYELFTIERIDNGLSDYDFESGSCVFIPLLSVREYPLIKKLENKGVKVVLTVHGVRNLDISADNYNYCYELGISRKAVCFFKEALIPIKKLVYREYIRKYLPYADCVITVSNYTLSKLYKIAKMKRVILQYESILPVEYSEKEGTGEYVFFVSGNRKEKNLARSIDAFKDYIACGGLLNLYVAGTNERVRKALIDNLGVQELVNNGKIVFFDYISDEELVSLYSGAKFLLYTSKSEGFGLPALEAATYGCPTVAAYGTSIPEVLGGAAYYVNPYSKESILDGIKYMNDELNISTLKSELKKRVEVSEYLAARSFDAIWSYLSDNMVR